MAMRWRAGLPVSFIAVAVAVALLGGRRDVPAALPAHPLEALTRQELSQAFDVLRAEQRWGPGARVTYAALKEPPKAEVLAYAPGAPIRREVELTLYERDANRTVRAVVDLSARKTVLWDPVSGVQPSFIGEDFELAYSLLQSSPEFQAAVRRRGIADPSQVTVECWPYGEFQAAESKPRLARLTCSYRGADGNYLARPLEGLFAEVDLSARRILRVTDRDPLPVPPPTPYQAGSIPRRPAVGGLQITQPRGAGYSLQGNEIRWQNWRFRFSVNPREGLVLHTVGYQDGARLRSVLYRGSLSEMAVPYGDPSEGWHFRAVFDAGENGMGTMAMPLQPGRDAPSNAVYFPAVLATEYGVAIERPQVVALYERDGGLLWKHYDSGSDRNESRRGQDLVLAYVATVGNYDYAFQWVFRQDGSLAVECLLTGIMTVKGIDPAAVTPYQHGREMTGHRVGQAVEAVHHQHFFNFRLDMDVDGADANSLLETNTFPLPRGPRNPHGNAFLTRDTLLQTDTEARRELNLGSSRRWRVIRRMNKNAWGDPVGYALTPGENSVPFTAPDASFRRRASFVEHHLWATPLAEGERFGAGEFVNQSHPGMDGLGRWTTQNRSIENRDLVLWYTMGITHIPRPEDWPVMPVHRAGFQLQPIGFFNANPALDLP